MALLKDDGTAFGGSVGSDGSGGAVLPSSFFGGATTGTDGPLTSLSGSFGISSGGVITSAGKGSDEASDDASDELTLKLSDLEEPAVLNAEGMVFDEVLPDKTELPVN